MEATRTQMALRFPWTTSGVRGGLSWAEAARLQTPTIKAMRGMEATQLRVKRGRMSRMVARNSATLGREDELVVGSRLAPLLALFVSVGLDIITERSLDTQNRTDTLP